MNIPCRGVAAILLFRAGQADSQECTRNICSYTETLVTLDGNPASPLFAQESIWKAIKTLLLKYFSDRLRRITCLIRHIMWKRTDVQFSPCNVTNPTCKFFVVCWHLIFDWPGNGRSFQTSVAYFYNKVFSTLNFLLLWEWLNLVFQIVLIFVS